MAVTPDDAACRSTGERVFQRSRQIRLLERKAAEWVLSVGGRARASCDGGELKRVALHEKLPARLFTVSV